jgi:uncharacterized protein (DUF342 family)
VSNDRLRYKDMASIFRAGGNFLDRYPPKNKAIVVNAADISQNISDSSHENQESNLQQVPLIADAKQLDQMVQSVGIDNMQNLLKMMKDKNQTASQIVTDVVNKNETQKTQEQNVLREEFKNFDDMSPQQVKEFLDKTIKTGEKYNL